MQSKELSNNHWQSVLDSVLDKPNYQAYAQLCFNFNNPLLRQLSTVSNTQLLELSISLLYTQALLSSHQPLNSKEMSLLNNGLLKLITLSLKGE
jgi:molecular chaperone HtpG